QSSLSDLLRVVLAEQPDLTVIGPELPLSLGIVDELQKRGLRVFGPTQAAAMLETSKAFAKDFMQRHKIPTAGYKVCQSLDDVKRELNNFPPVVVVKADGLAAGKGVILCASHEEAVHAAQGIFNGDLLGAAGAQLVLEELMVGPEISFFALCDGTSAVPLACAQDHKRIGEGDTGPNTGGMGAYSTDELMDVPTRAWVMEHVALPAVRGMKAEGTPFTGILFIGLMMTADGPRVLEFNTRFGDPETQTLMMRLESDIVDLFDAAIDGRVSELKLKWKPGAAACVVAASGGYPGKFTKGLAIHGLDAKYDGVEVFHAGTALQDGAIVTAGGRVLGVTAADADLRGALKKIYAALEHIEFEGMVYRRDIGHRAL
ncbi:MAG TPA: phosphoribosylamine--glycine ligase, partial [Acidobacteriaceae bacterium]|nr:phosphoribosylamine--glycine ligase [Acidobacteriaceae bacterium]